MASPSPRHLLRQAISAARGGDRSRARMFLAKVTELDPEDPIGWLWRAGLAEEPEQALVWLHRAIDLDPEHPDALRAQPIVTMQAAQAVLWAGDFSMARHLFDKAAALDRKNPAPWLHLAGMARTPEEAAQCLHEVLAREPDHAGARQCLDRIEADRAAAAEAQMAAQVAAQVAIPTPQSIEIPNPPSAENGGVVIDELLMPSEPASQLAAQPATPPDAHPTPIVGVQKIPSPSSAEFVKSLPTPARAPAPETMLEQPAADDQLIPVNLDEPDPPPPEPRHGTVLVIDDNPDVRDFVHRHLRALGLAVHSAEGADAAIALLREHGCPDLILLDGVMPGVDGFQLCNLLRQNAATAHVPIVLLARKDGWLPRIKSMMSGFTDTLAKPISPLTLRDLVSKYCHLSIDEEGSESSWPELSDEVLK